MRDALLFPLTPLLVLLLGIAVPCMAQSEKSTVLTNADVVRMVKAGISESIIEREIQMSETSFSTSPSALIELKKHGISDGILAAMLDSRAGGGMPATAAAGPPAGLAPYGNPGPHHLPNFEADLRVNSTAQGKLSVGRNQIKLERSGVPVFDLKWKEKH